MFRPPQVASGDIRRMIYTGIDLIEIPRIAGVLERYPRRFLEKVFTRGEQRYARGRPHQLASRFAAKEAVNLDQVANCSSHGRCLQI